jgi:hypothetical protein
MLISPSISIFRNPMTWASSSISFGVMAHILALFLAIPLGAQELPNAPQPQPSVWHRQWDYNRPQRGYIETIRDPWFIGPFVGLLATNVMDIEATRASGCGEASEFGRKPSRLEQYGQDFAVDFAVGTLAFFLQKSHIKVIPQAMLGYGIAIHIKGTVSGLGSKCQ